MKMGIVEHALLRNGVILERAKRRGASLSKIERILVEAGRNLAKKEGLAQKTRNALEMEGERDWGQVLLPLTVLTVFSYYDDPYEDFPARPSYLVLESNHPGMSVGSHICAEQLQEVNIKIPKTPTYEKWVKGGRKNVSR